MGSGVFITPPPAKADITHNGKWNKCEVKNAGVHSLCRFLTQLLGCFGANGALG